MKNALQLMIPLLTAFMVSLPHKMSHELVWRFVSHLGFAIFHCIPQFCGSSPQAVE